MYICVCKAVSDKRLRRAVDAGEVMTLRELTSELGVGTCCGKCIPAAKSALTEALSARQPTTPMHAGSQSLEACAA